MVPYLVLLCLIPSFVSTEESDATPRWSFSFRDDIILRKRQVGYHPLSGLCGSGNTCSAACGKNYETCQSDDVTALHCFDPEKGQTCCPNGSGYACDAGYYCAQDALGKTFCCPNGMSLATCASLYTATSLQYAHSTTTILYSTYITPTITAISTIFVTLSSTTTSFGLPSMYTSTSFFNTTDVIDSPGPTLPSSGTTNQNGTSVDSPTPTSTSSGILNQTGADIPIVSYTGRASIRKCPRAGQTVTLGIGWVIALWGL